MSSQTDMGNFKILPCGEDDLKNISDEKLNEIQQFLIECTCCERHCVKKDDISGNPSDEEVLDPDCICSCRHNCRMVKRVLRKRSK